MKTKGAPVKNVTQNDEQAIRELVRTWLEASEKNDLETVLGLMADDVVFMVPGKEPFGKEEFAQGWASSNANSQVGKVGLPPTQLVMLFKLQEIIP